MNQKYTIENIKGINNPNVLFFLGNTEKKGKVTKACLSQWYDCKFMIDGITYLCAEHYMMAQKAKLFGDNEIFKEILDATEPSKMKALGRMVKGYNEELWDKHKFNIVFDGNLAKFSQNKELQEFLLSTGDDILVEASPYDKIWGIGMRYNEEGVTEPLSWKGLNLLGFALMQVRDLLRK